MSDDLKENYTKLNNKYIKLKQQLEEKDAEIDRLEKKFDTLYKLFTEQHELIDQYELECFEEVNRLLKEQKDFYIVEKVEYDKIIKGAKEIVMQKSIEELEDVFDYAMQSEGNVVLVCDYIKERIKELEE